MLQTPTISETTIYVAQPVKIHLVNDFPLRSVKQWLENQPNRNIHILVNPNI